jgi:hypothetical protein
MTYGETHIVHYGDLGAIEQSDQVTKTGRSRHVFQHQPDAPVLRLGPRGPEAAVKTPLLMPAAKAIRTHPGATAPLVSQGPP